MKIFLFAFGLNLLFGFSNLGAQGLVFDDESYERVVRQSQYGDGSKSENKALESTLKVDLKPYCPKVYYQGSIGSCVGWSVGYGAYTIQTAIKNDWKDQIEKISRNAYSAMFIYNQIKLTDCDYGARIEDALELIKTKGNIPSTVFDKDISDCFKEPDETEMSLAAQNRIKDYLTLFSPDDSKRIKVNKTKLSLIQNHPVVIGMDLKKNFYDIRRGEEYWYPKVGNTNPGGGHAMVVVGYDEGKKAFELMNSWGELWGNDGFIWVNYDDFANHCKYGFQFSINDPLEKPQLSFANMIFRRPVIRTNDTIIYSEEALILKEDMYELRDKKWKKGDVFQLVISDVSEGSYFYAFSFDAEGQIKIHWPRDEKLDHRFEGLHESALITVPEVELVIPGPHSALQITKAGSDYICLLFTSEPISGFNKKIKKVRDRKGKFLKRLKNAFKGDLLSFSDVNYDKESAHFLNQLPSGKIVPLVLKIEVD